MQGLPLALATAGAYLLKSIWTFERYLEEYEKRWNVSPRRPLQLREYQDRTLYTTWDLSYRRLRKEDTNAARLLKLLAYFNNQHIWFDLMHAGITDDCPEWLIAIIGDASNFESIMMMLTDYCFVEPQLASQSYSLHVCVHDWTLAGLNQHVESWSYWYAFACVANSILSATRTRTLSSRSDMLAWHSLGQIRYARLAPHAVRLTHPNFDEVGEKIPANHIYGIEYISKLLQDQAQLRAAELLYLRALAGNETALGPGHTSTLDTVNNLGILYRNQGKLDKAEQMYLRALAGYETALGPKHTSMLNTVNNLGGLYWDQGKLDKAEQMWLRALAGRETALGPKHILTLDSKHCIANLYRDQGKVDEAESIYESLIISYERASGDDHPSTMMLVHNFGVLYEHRSRLKDTERIYQ